MSDLENFDEAPEITPQVLHLRDLLKWVRQGRVRVPNFQRDFTWDRGRMLHLFDSIRKQYPIGTLLFWESTTPRPMLDNLGPLKLPNYLGGKLLVLDGQQRLTTLAGVLLLDELASSDVDDHDQNRWKIWYDAASDTFAYFEAPAPLSAVRVSHLMGTKGIYTAAQRIMSEPGLHSNELKEQWISRVENVAGALGTYRLPLVIFATESLRLAVESFTRLNRSGQAMGADEMFSALTYDAKDGDEAFRLSSHIDAILSEIARTNFGPVDRVVVLRVVLLAAGLDPYRTEWDQLAKDTQTHTAAKLPDAIKEARNGLLAAVAFLKEEGVHNSRLLPYSMQLVGLAAFYGVCNLPTPQQKVLLRRWLWVSSFTELFGGLNPSRVHQQLRNLREVIPYNATPLVIEGIDLDAPAHPFPERHDNRSARVRALLCVILRQSVIRPDGSVIAPNDMASEVLERGPNALAKICARVESRGNTLLVASPANRIFDVAKDTRGQAKNWLLSLIPLMKEIDQDILNSHYISQEAYDALVNGDHATFVECRIATLTALERNFMDEKGVTKPKSDQPAPSAIDVEDDVPLSESVDMEGN